MTVSAIYDFLLQHNAEKCKESKCFVKDHRLPAALSGNEEVFFIDENIFLLFVEPSSDFVRISYYIRPFEVMK